MTFIDQLEAKITAGNTPSKTEALALCLVAKMAYDMPDEVAIYMHDYTDEFVALRNALSALKLACIKGN